MAYSKIYALPVQDFLARCLDADLKSRVTAASALEQPWMRLPFGGENASFAPSYDELYGDESPMTGSQVGPEY